MKSKTIRRPGRLHAAAELYHGRRAFPQQRAEARGEPAIAGCELVEIAIQEPVIAHLLEQQMQPEPQVVDADPLVTVRNLRQIRYVVKNGRMVDRVALPAVRVLQFDPEARWPR